KAVEDRGSFGETVVDPAGKLIGDRQAQNPLRELMMRVDREDIATDGLRLFRFVEITIAFCLGNGGTDSGMGNRFQLHFHGLLLAETARERARTKVSKANMRLPQFPESRSHSIPQTRLRSSA